MLEKVVFRGEAAEWRDADGKVEWLDTIEGGEGYRIKKLRYEALPGLWIPALLYEPDEARRAKCRSFLNVNGHDGNGKAADYKQIRCINLAKRGMHRPERRVVRHGPAPQARLRATTRMNQLDLCGTSGLAPFYLAMKRGLDVLLAHPTRRPDARRRRRPVRRRLADDHHQLARYARDAGQSGRRLFQLPDADPQLLRTWATPSRRPSIWRRTPTTPT